MGVIDNSKINEASGIASSKINPKLIWVHNDSGDMARVYAIGLDGSYLGVLRLPGIIARDWEDMSIGPGPKDNTDYIYIGDIGDNFSKKNKKRIYRFEEPEVNIESLSIPFNMKINDVDKITFTYPDNKSDSETLMIDPLTRDIYIITKRESSPYIYSLPYPQSTSSIIVADLIGNLTISPKRPYLMSDRIVSGDISRDGSMILIKTYYQIILINRNSKLPFSSIIKEEQRVLDYIVEPQGESACWSWDQSGYFTISEQVKNTPVHLYYYSN
tara:strand:+ start:53 stop:868 length:816 start_codon:yes stop_codon:yes gene_type:complete